MKRQIANIINFIRSVEPRPGENADLIKPVKNQIQLLLNHDLKGTFLFQYDALINPEFRSIFDLYPNRFELGIWLEIVEPLATKAGIEWKGRYLWDWHAHCGFTVGYTLDERERIVDAVMHDFKEVFYQYPKSIGSWSLDAHTIAYLEEKYAIDAICICKDQWGTDGYSLWGGYYNQGYYPGKDNYFCPAQTQDKQIGIPVFRMLGSDPIYQYDAGLSLSDGASAVQPVITLEPVYHEIGGGNDSWTDWYFRENFNGNCLSFGYTQVGQENSFAWENMSHGLAYQFEQLEKLQKTGMLEVETLGETGRWFKRTYEHTPASVVAALSDPLSEGRKSIWYSSRYYRINLYIERNKFWIRDMYLFHEDYRERYFNGVCQGDQLYFDNLPIMDGNRWSGNMIRAGIYPLYEVSNEIRPFIFEDMIYDEINGNAVISFKGTACENITFTLLEDKVDIEVENKTARLLMKPEYDTKSKYLSKVTKRDEKAICLDYNGFRYNANFELGTIDENYCVRSEEGKIRFTWCK